MRQTRALGQFYRDRYIYETDDFLSSDYLRNEVIIYSLSPFIRLITIVSHADLRSLDRQRPRLDQRQFDAGRLVSAERRVHLGQWYRVAADSRSLVDAL